MFSFLNISLVIKNSQATVFNKLLTLEIYNLVTLDSVCVKRTKIQTVEVPKSSICKLDANINLSIVLSTNGITGRRVATVTLRWYSNVASTV